MVFINQKMLNFGFFGTGYLHNNFLLANSATLAALILFITLIWLLENYRTVY